MLRLLPIALAALALPAVGEPIDLSGARLVPPRGFARLADELVAGSAALAPLLAGEAPRALVAAFAEVGADEPATLAVLRVERPLPTGPSARSAAASALAGHFRTELDLEVAVDRPRLVQGPHGLRIEAAAHPRAGRSARLVRFAFVPAGAAHWVLAASMPEAREAQLAPAIDEAFDAFSPAQVAPAPARRGALRAVAFGALGLGLALGVQLWRRRRRPAPD